MRSNSLLVWQVRLWLLALASVLLLGNTRAPAGGDRAQQIGTADQAACSAPAPQPRSAAAPRAAGTVTVAGSVGAKKCRAAAVTETRGEHAVLAGG